MKLLKRILRHDGINLAGKVSSRSAVRGIIPGEGKRLLMVFSATRGDYKFPGGGVNKGETHARALAREIREECGATATSLGPGFGKVIEYDFSEMPGCDVFKMTSHYYWCEIEATFQPQKLDDYEADLGFQPVWVEVAEAIEKNKTLLANSQDKEIFWLRRETFILETLQREELHGSSFR